MYLTYNDLAERFGVSLKTIQKLVRQKKIKCVKIAGCRRFRKQDVEEYEKRLLWPTMN